MTQHLTISQLEKESESNLHYSGVVEIPFGEFRKRVLAHDDEIFRDLFEGKVFIVRNAYPQQKLLELRKTIHELGQSTSPVFHKIQGDCPNFHVINEGNPQYKVLMRMHSYHFFSWNDGPVGLFQDTSEPLEVYETLCEYDPSKIVRNTCADDVVVRLQIHHYPLGGGHTQMHTDPTQLVKVAWVMPMTKRGVDYETGGLYFFDLFGNKFHPESSLEINVGDCIVFYPKLLHGVDAVDVGETSEWDSENGRWALIFNNLPVAKGP